MEKIKLLVNLPPAFHTSPVVTPVYRRLGRFARLRKRSHDTPEQVLPDLKWADAVLMWSWPALTHELLEAAGGIRFSAQLDIGGEAARVALERGLPVSVAKGAWAPAVAEMALALTLTTLRKVSDYHAAMSRGKEQWVRALPADVDPDERELTGRSVGIIGFGSVGRRFRELLVPFRCDVRVYDPYASDAVLKRAQVKRTGLMELLRRSEVVELMAASNEGTRHLLGAKHIAVLRKSAVLVNVARAALVDTDALIERLKQRDLYAAIDVFDREPLPRNHPLRRLPNVHLTPHRAGGLLASVDRILNWLVDDMEAFLAGEKRKYALTKKMLPALDG